MDITQTMRVTVRTKTAILKSDLSLDDAVKFLDTDTTPRRAVIMPNGGHMEPGFFRGWVASTKAAVARNAARANA